MEKARVRRENESAQYVFAQDQDGSFVRRDSRLSCAAHRADRAQRQYVNVVPLV